MSRLVLRLIGLALAATVGLVLVVDLGVKRPGLAVEVYLDFLCGLLLFWLVVTVRSRLPAASELGRFRIRQPLHKAVRPQQLEWLERQIGDTRASGFELPYQFRPVVRNIASAALVREHGVVIERDPERARAIVGERVWQLIRPEDPVNELPAGGFRALVADLETI